ncbi:hypothetical protein EJB05_40115, partial [Eragrostis curvula]
MHHAHPFARENINEPSRDWMLLVDTVVFIFVGFLAGADYCDQAIHAALAKKILYETPTGHVPPPPGEEPSTAASGFATPPVPSPPKCRLLSFSPAAVGHAAAPGRQRERREHGKGETAAQVTGKLVILKNGRLGGSSNEAKANVSWKSKEEVDRFLAKLEKEGVEIDDKIASIVDDGIARTKAEAVRENIKKETKREAMKWLYLIGCMAIGFIMGAEWNERAFRAAIAKGRRALDEELTKTD